MFTDATFTLLKIPLLILLALDVKAIFTPPQAPPPKNEVLETIALDIPVVRNYRLALIRNGQILLSIAEILLILARAFPDSPISPTILSYLVFAGGNPAGVKLSAPSLLSALLWIGGARIRRWTFRELGRFFRFEISIQRDHRLITTGPYAYVRHPSYTGLLLVTAGWLMWTFAPGSWVRESGVLGTPLGKAALLLYLGFGLLPASVLTLTRMAREDVALRKQFGAQWEDWYRRVPYAVVPWVY